MTPSVDHMHPRLHDAYLFWKQRMASAHIEYILTCVLRTKEEQKALFAQGREPISVVNSLRKACGMYELAPKENLRKVTWTNNSKHFADTDGYSRAFDYAILLPGKKIITWDTKWDGDLDGIPEYMEAAQFAKEVGLEAGAFWDTPDYPHVQVNGALLL